MGLWQRIWALLRRGRMDRELEEEIATHLAMQEREFQLAGMTPQASRDAARREFGGLAQTAELYRERRGIAWLENTAKDLRYAVRGLRRDKGFAAAAVLSLALGIGGNTAIFSLFHALLLRMLPVAHPDELVMFHRTGAWGRGVSYPFYLDVEKRDDLFQGVVARSDIDAARLTVGSRIERAQREYVSGNYFGVLGVGAALGRVIGESDNITPHAHPIAVLSYDFWMNRFGGDPGVLGQKVVLGEEPFTIAGVAARGFRGVEVDHHPDVWVPAMMRPGRIMEPGANWAWIVARRRPGISRRQVQAAADVMLRQYLTSVYGGHPNAGFRKIAMSQQIDVRDAGVGLSELRDEFGKPLKVLMLAVGLVLLVACANVANLLLARGAARRREVAVRVSLGAVRSRLVKQGIVESLLLAVLGAAFGLAFAWWGTRGILQFLPGEAGQALSATPNAAVLAFTAALAVGAALLFGIAPALRTTSVDPASNLQSGGRQTSAQAGLRRGLVILQVAFSVVLVVLAGLFGHSLSELRAFDPGFHNQNVLAFGLEFPRSWKPAQTKAARDQFIGQVETMPGVSLVTYAFPGPFQSGYSSATVRVPGSEATATAAAWVGRHYIAPRFFEAIGATVVQGREFARTDTEKSRQVAVVNEAFLRKFLPGDQHPLEHVLEMGDQPTYIVGVVHDIAHDGLREKIEPRVYVPIAQVESGWEPSILIRAAVPAEALIPAMRRELSHVGPQVGISEPKTIHQRVEESIFQERLLATLGGVFGFLALALAAVGLYGVVAYGTTRRAREIGIRIALGAMRGEVVWMVLRDALVLAVAGLAVGLPAAYVAARQISALLFGIRPTDAISFVSTASVLLGIGIAAAFVPACRAAALEPLSVLRED